MRPASLRAILERDLDAAGNNSRRRPWFLRKIPDEIVDQDGVWSGARATPMFIILATSFANLRGYSRVSQAGSHRENR